MSRIKQYYRSKVAKRARERSKKSDALFDKYSEPLSIFTGALVLVTLGLVVVGVLQWQTLDKTDHTIRSGQRAFVFVKTDASVWHKPTQYAENFVWTYAVAWENNGNSQTQNLKIKLYCPRPTWFAIIDPVKSFKPDVIQSERLLGPKQVTFGGGCNYTDTELSAIAKEKQHLYIASTAEYQDIYGEPHVTRFCNEILNLTGDFRNKDTIIQGDLAVCGHNCADEDCESK